MRSPGLGLCLFLLGLLLVSTSRGSPDLPFSNYRAETRSNFEDVRSVSRKFKERSYVISTTSTKRALDSVNVEDYPRYDPSPSSKAAIKSGPIQHGTPLMPHIPLPTPPNHPKHGSP